MQGTRFFVSMCTAAATACPGGYRFVCDKAVVLGDTIKRTLCVLLLLLLLLLLCKLAYITIMLPVVLYGCETWSVTLREEHRLRGFENRVLRKILGPKKDGVVGKCRGLHNEVYDLYYSPNII